MLSEEPINALSKKILGQNIFIKNEIGCFHLNDTGEAIFALISFMAAVFVYFGSRFMFSTSSQTYRGLGKKDRMFWDLAVVRAVFGFVGSSLAFYERIFDEVLYTNVTKATTVQSSILVSCCLGFFTFEVMAQILFDIIFKTFSKALHLHHFVSISGFIITAYYDIGHYFPLSVFTLELSTLFSCICYCLIKSNMAESLLWKVNQQVLIYVFHFRTVIEFKLLYEIYELWDFKKNMPFIWNLNLICGLVLLGFFLTPYWTYRKTEQYFKKSDWNDTKSKKSQ